MSNSKNSAKEAAQRYAEDEAFAAEFDRTLASLYEEQRRRLERIGKKLGHANSLGAPGRSHDDEPLGMPAALLTPERVLDVLGQKGSAGLTRGEIAIRLGVDSRDGSFTRVLRHLKTQGHIKQRGTRRSARYSLAAPRR